MQPPSTRRPEARPHVPAGNDPSTLSPSIVARLAAADPLVQRELARAGLLIVPAVVMSRSDLSAAQKLLWIALWALAGCQAGGLTTSWEQLASMVGRSSRSLQPAGKRPGPLQELIDLGALQRRKQPGVELALYVVHPDRWPERKSAADDRQKVLPACDELAEPLGETFEGFTGEIFKNEDFTAGGEGGASARSGQIEEEEEEDSCVLREQETLLPPPPLSESARRETFIGARPAVKPSKVSPCEPRRLTSGAAGASQASTVRPAPAANQDFPWFRVERRLRKTGLKAFAKAALQARQSGVPAAVVEALADFYEAHRGAWNQEQPLEEPGVIMYAIRAWRPGDDPARDWDLWPTTCREYRQQQAAAARHREEQRQGQRSAAEQAALRRLIDRTRAHLDALDDEEREGLVLAALAGYPVLYDRWRKAGAEATLALAQIGRHLFDTESPS